MRASAAYSARQLVEQRLDLDLRHVQRHDARIEAREVEQIVDEQRHALDLNLQRREVRRGIAHAVLERLGGGAEVGERRAQVVTGGSHELALCPQEPVEGRAHLVDDRGHLAQLAGAGDRRTRLQFPLGEALRRAPERAQRQRDGARDEQRADERRGRRRRGDQRDERVVARVEHDQPRGDDGDQRQPRGQQGEAGEPQAERRQQPQRQTADDAGAQRAEREREREREHQGTKR